MERTALTPGRTDRTDDSLASTIARREHTDRPVELRHVPLTGNETVLEVLDDDLELVLLEHRLDDRVRSGIVAGARGHSVLPSGVVYVSSRSMK